MAPSAAQLNYIRLLAPQAGCHLPPPRSMAQAAWQIRRLKELVDLNRRPWVDEPIRKSVWRKGQTRQVGGAVEIRRDEIQEMEDTCVTHWAHHAWQPLPSTDD